MINDCLATEQFLKTKGFANPSCCRFCCAAEEDIDHIFLHCSFVMAIWSCLQTIFNRQINRSGDLNKLFTSAFKVDMSAQVKNLWVCGIISTLRIIWNLRNAVMFEDKVPNLHQAFVLSWGCIKEADALDSGTLHNSIDDLLILKSSKISRISKAPKNF